MMIISPVSFLSLHFYSLSFSFLQGYIYDKIIVQETG